MPPLPNHHPNQTSAQQHPSMHRSFQHLPPQRSLSDRWSYNRQLAMHTPRLLDGEGRPLSDTCAEAVELRNEFNNGAAAIGDIWRDNPGLSAPSSSMNVAGSVANQQQGIYLRSQRLQSHYQTLERAAAKPYNAATSSSSFTAFPNPIGSPWNSAYVPEPAESAPQRSMSGYGVSNASAPRSVLRQRTAGNMNSIDGVTAATPSFQNIKSNSLPRRQPGRTIKWRTDLPPTVGGDSTASIVSGGMNPNSAALLGYSSDMSDSDSGAVSAPEFMMSPANRGVPQPVYPLPREYNFIFRQK
jgi:hypothetical protein